MDTILNNLSFEVFDWPFSIGQQMCTNKVVYLWMDLVHILGHRARQDRTMQYRIKIDFKKSQILKLIVLDMNGYYFK
jgi:hypothetical protein